MPSSRATRLGASILLNLALSAGLASGAFAASPTDSGPGPSAKTVVAAAPTPVAASAVTSTQVITTVPASQASATELQTRPSVPACQPPLSDPRLPLSACPGQGTTSGNTSGSSVMPATGTTYSIQGTITGLLGAPLVGINVDAFGPNGNFVGTSGAGGHYSIDVPDGSYRVWFNSSSDTYTNGYYTTLHSGTVTFSWSEASVVTVNGAPRTGIDGRLVAGKDIKGRVTDGVSPIMTILVSASSDVYSGSIYTDSNGDYSITVPDAASYYMDYSDPNASYVHGYYGSGAAGHITYIYANATHVPVSGGPVVGIDVQMVEGVKINGTVTGVGGAPLASIIVEASSTTFDDRAWTGSDGTYSISVLDSSSYTLRLEDDSDSYFSGYYDSGATGHFTLAAGSATPMPVDGDDVAADVQMRQPGPWSVTIGASSPSVRMGDSVTLTAVANQDVGALTAKYIVILRSDLSAVMDCRPGTTCAGTDWSPSLSSETYHAVVGYWDGTTSVVATSNAVTVAWVPNSIELTPATASIVAAGSQAYTVEGFDGADASLGDVTSDTTFTISGGGSCAGSSCTSTVAGNHTVTGSDGVTTATATLNVTPGPADHLVLSPADATISAGAPPEIYTANSVDSYGNVIADVTSATTFSLSNASGSAGSCTGAACSPTVVGAITVSAVDGSLHASTTLNVTVGPADHLVLSPADATISAGAPPEIYTANSVDSYGNVIADVTSATTFSLSNASGSAGSCTGAACSPTVVGAITVSAVDGSLHASTTLNVTYSGAVFHAVTPGRVLDSRTSLGAGLFHSRVKQSFQVSGLFGVPDGAVAVTGNVTVVGQTALGYVTVAPSLATGTQPGTSTINFPEDDIRANGITVPLGAGGKLDAMYWAGSTSDTVNVLFDVTGYFANDTTGATYHAITPGRVVDSRTSSGAATFHSRTKQPFQVTGLFGVPSDAVAVTGNVTIVGQTGLGYVSLAPSLAAATQPGTSTINFPAGDIRANGITVPLGADGKLDAMYWTGSTSDTVNILFDVTGYFSNDVYGATYYTITPQRVLDTRSHSGAATFTSRTKQAFAVGETIGHLNAMAVTGNVTVVGQTALGYVSLAPSLAATTQPGTSTINFPAGDIRANGITVPLGADGKLDAMYWAGSTTDTVNVLFDVTGYFVAPPR